MANVKTALRRTTGAAERPAAKLSRGEFVYQQILEAIADGHLRDGPIREADIASRLGVSRTPVRESLQRLQERGLLIASGRSLVVATLSEREVLELYAMREILEGAAARFAAERATIEDIAILHRLHEAYMDAKGNKRLVMQRNWRFHRAIYEAAHNRHLLQASDGMHDTLFLIHGSNLRQFVQADASNAQHLQIIGAIEKRDPERAEAVAREHVRTAVQTYNRTDAEDWPARWAGTRSLLLS